MKKFIQINLLSGFHNFNPRVDTVLFKEFKMKKQLKHYKIEKIETMPKIGIVYQCTNRKFYNIALKAEKPMDLNFSNAKEFKQELKFLKHKGFAKTIPDQTKKSVNSKNKKEKK
jgi:hypothetical protein